jgi:hypothetical protein
MYACIEIKEGIENMKLMHVIYMMKRKSNKRNIFVSHLNLQLERLVKRIKNEI